MIDEKKYVIDAFSCHFEVFKQNKLVIYGIGKHTQHILEYFGDHNFVGLMDEARTGERIYGKTIISKDQALELGVDTIIIVARANNVRIIFRRIAEFCAANAISVYDINGNLLEAESGEEKSFHKYSNVSMKALKEKIAKADVVSFDIFDTLIMRKALYPRDIFMIVESKISELWQGSMFFKARINAEMELYGEGKNPNLHDIYDRMQQILKITDEVKSLWKNIEVEAEEEYLVRREAMCDALNYSRVAGKEVFLVSDMYLPGSILWRLLNRLGIDADESRILVSCEYGVSKSNGLFDVLRSKAGEKKILHIGDNIDADERFAIQYGIDDTFHIESAVTMLENSYACGLLKYDNKLCNRKIIGEFISKQLNDPFLFSMTRGRFHIKSNYDLAYSFLAPMICAFIGWMAIKAKELQLEHILFSARDGYLLEKISRAFCESIPDFPLIHYFYTSRAAAVLAGLHSDEDILYAEQLAYAGSTEEMLKSRFLLTADEIQERSGCSDEEYVLKHRDAIMMHSEAARKNYLRYLDVLNIRKGAKVGFVDFVSSGTCQKGLLGVTDFDLYGLYFAQLYDEYKEDLNIESMFGMECAYKESYHLLKNYFFMENVLTSYEPTLHSFDEAGRPVFLPENRTEKQFEALKEIHCAIIDFVGQTKINPCQLEVADMNLADLIFHFLQDQYSEKTTDYFKTEVLEDQFCNRKFEIGKNT